MESLPEHLVAEFLSEHAASGSYLRDHVARLAELAMSKNREVAEVATRAIFASLVERLADSFDVGAVSLYNRAFAQLIQSCRENARGREIDRALAGFGLQREEDLVARAEMLRQVRPSSARDAMRTVRRVIILSRVTLGADVAITSVIVERMKRSFPSVEIVLVGGGQAPELFGGDPRLEFKEVSYTRAGTTIERLLSWPRLVECLRGLTSDLESDEYLIVDPDTRLTQLGLLPVTRCEDNAAAGHAQQIDPSVARAHEHYLFFPSREYGRGTSRSLGELTSAWLDEVIGEEVLALPRVSLGRADIQAARDLVTGIRRGSRPIVALNFGVGENPMKRVGDEFEKSLIARLIQAGAMIVLDKGSGQEEGRRAESIIAHAAGIERDGRRVQVLELNEESLKRESDNSSRLNADLFAWDGRIGMLAALIGESDLYTGYDSAGQHIAAALGVPCIDVFAGFCSSRFVERWRPTGKASIRLVTVDQANTPGESELVERVLQHAGKMLRARNGTLKIEI